MCKGTQRKENHYSLGYYFYWNVTDVIKISYRKCRDFLGGTVVKNPPANAGDTVRALVPVDPTCRRATKPVHHNY